MGADAVEARLALAFVTGIFDAQLQAVGEKAEGVEQRAFANAVLPNYRSQGSQRCDIWVIPKPTEGYILQHSVISGF